jgi:nitrate/TMAO reductase-like tetraheme cytochrome c subunit
MTRFPLPKNPFSLAGAVLATLSAVLFLIVFFLDVLGLHTNPYLGIVFFIVFPSLFVIGLLLIPVGVWRDRRRRLAGKPEFHWLRVDLNDPHQRSVTFFIVALTLVNLVIVSLAAYSGVEYMDSVQFCGQVCHTVMQPEFAAYEDGAHSRVTCVQCHIGPGAGWFVKSKLSGARQVVAVTLGTYSRPIASPVHNLRPARETCEQCHWPEKFHGDMVRVAHDYADDEKNTESTTTLNVHVGGGSDRLGIATGIHWHMNVANKIEYITTDDKRQVIPWVKMTDRFGNVREYTAEGVTPADLAKGETRTMDCVDCHNRPAHPMDPTPDKAVNRVLATGEMPKTLPFIKREATAALKESYPSETAAVDAIAVRLREFYRTQQSAVYMGRRQEVERAVSATQQIYRRNIFPAMNITWGTYANNIGHMDFPGCFRCHDAGHATKDGKVIAQSCDLCHSMQ